MDLVSPQRTHLEPFRPRFHFSPPSAWMNDPNGLFPDAGLGMVFSGSGVVEALPQRSPEHDADVLT